MTLRLASSKETNMFKSRKRLNRLKFNQKGEMSHFLHSRNNNDTIKLNVPMNMPCESKLSWRYRISQHEKLYRGQERFGRYIEHCDGNAEASSMSGDIEINSCKVAAPLLPIRISRFKIVKSQASSNHTRAI